jgi:hypothetical protein
MSMGNKHPQHNQSCKFLYWNKTINFSTQMPNWITNYPVLAVSFQAVMTGGTWVKVRGLGDRNPFSQRVVRQRLLFGEESPHILCNMKVYKGMPLVPILNQANLNSLPSSFSEINFNIILPFVTRSFQSFVQSGFILKSCKHFSSL